MNAGDGRLRAAEDQGDGRRRVGEVGAFELEGRIGARALTGAGFALFALGLGLSAFQPRTADFDEMFWPQIVRGVAIMFCLLPPTRIALGALPEWEVADASGLATYATIAATSSGLANRLMRDVGRTF